MKCFLSKLSWYYSNNIRVTGFILSGEKLLREKELLDYFSDVSTISEFESKLRSANGQFSVVINRDNEIWAATDITRNWPLFYTRIEGEFILSDDCYRLAELRSENRFDPVSYNCFLASGYTIKDRTLIKDIFQVEAGAIVILASDVKSSFYHNPAQDTSADKDLHTEQKNLPVCSKVHSEDISVHLKTGLLRFLYQEDLIPGLWHLWPQNIIQKMFFAILTAVKIIMKWHLQWSRQRDLG